MSTEHLSYHKAAGKFLKAYYEQNAATSISFSYRFINRLAYEAKQIAKSLSLKDMDYQNAIVATWFRFAGVTDITAEHCEIRKKLLGEYFTSVNYPEEEKTIVEQAILTASENKYAETKVAQVVCDACNSLLANQNLPQNIILLREELNRITGTDKTELFYSKHFYSLFIRTRYYTDYAREEYSYARENNFEALEKRIRKLEDKERSEAKENSKLNNGAQLSSKETEDLFKIAFRNYNQLVSVADSKASLLINVNSIIVSVMLAFVISKIENNQFLLWPTILLLVVCMITILLSILASKPQKNSLLENKESASYQRFFFGSFDLIDPVFRHANWEEYYSQLNKLFNSPKEEVYLEIYKESYNVRKVLSRKFNYLSKAYWVFIIGLLLSIVAFMLAIRSQMGS